MKKRKELNALLGSSRRPKAPNQNEATELLPSSSSEADVYIAPASSSYRMATKRVTRSNIGGLCNFRRVIRICLPICFLSLVAACITACVGIVWMQVQLQTDLELIKMRLSRLDGWQDSQQPAVKNMQKSVAEIEQNLHTLETKENGVTDLAHKLNLLVAKVDDQITEPMQAIEKVKNDISTVIQRIATLEENVKSLQSTSDQMKQTQNDFGKKFNKKEEEINELKTKIEAKNSESDLQQLVPKLNAELKNEIASLNESLNLVSHRVKVCEKNIDEDSSEEKISHEKLDKIDRAVTSNEQNIKETNETLSLLKETFNGKITKLYDKVFPPPVKNNPEDGGKGQPDISSITLPPEDGDKELSEKNNDDPLLLQAQFAPVPSHHTDTIIGDTTASVTEQPNEIS